MVGIREDDESVTSALFLLPKFNVVEFNTLAPYSVPSNGTTSKTLPAILAQLVAKGVVTSDQVGLSLAQEPPLNIPANKYVTITPGREDALPGQAEGQGRFASGYVSSVWVNCYCRLALDWAYQDTQLLTNASGLRTLVFDVISALETWLPVDSKGIATAQQPLRLLANPNTIKWKRSGEWAYLSLPFQYLYTRPCSNQIFV